MTKKKDNDMICNGAMPPQMAHIMGAYNAYVNYMTAMYYAWAAVSGWKYYQSQCQAVLNRMSQEQDQE